MGDFNTCIQAQSNFKHYTEKLHTTQMEFNQTAAHRASSQLIACVSLQISSHYNIIHRFTLVYDNELQPQEQISLLLQLLVVTTKSQHLNLCQTCTYTYTLTKLCEEEPWMQVQSIFKDYKSFTLSKQFQSIKQLHTELQTYCSGLVHELSFPALAVICSPEKVT